MRRGALDKAAWRLASAHNGAAPKGAAHRGAWAGSLRRLAASHNGAAPKGAAHRGAWAGGFRRLAAALALLLVVGAAAGCGGIIEGGGVQRLDDVPEKTVVIWHTYSDEESRVFEDVVIPAFEREHPGVHIESVRQAYTSELQPALIARASAGKTPDLIRVDYTWVGRFASANLLYPLDGLPEFTGTASSLQERMLAAGRYGDRQYGLPLNMNTKAAIYNRELLARSGLPGPPASMSELVEAAESGGLILGMQDLQMWASLPYVFGLGGQLADENFTRTSGYLNGETTVKAVETLLRLYKEGRLTSYLLTRDGNLWEDVYAGNGVLMIDEGPWYYSILMGGAEPRADLLDRTVPAPFPTDGAYGSLAGGESLVMTKGSRWKPEAWRFMQWMMREETQLQMYGTGLIPTNREALQSLERDSRGPDNAYMAAYLEGFRRAFVRPPLPRWREIEMIYEDAMEDIFVGGRDVRQALNEASAAIDGLLKRT